MILEICTLLWITESVDDTSGCDGVLNCLVGFGLEITREHHVRTDDERDVHEFLTGVTKSFLSLDSLLAKFELLQLFADLHTPLDVSVDGLEDLFQFIW